MAAGDGLISMTPTSIAYSGTSASINADGGVDFSAVTSLSLNGVFTSDYDNYLVVISGVQSTTLRSWNVRLRASGSDDSGSNYTYQRLIADSSSVTGSRTSSNTQAALGRVDTGIGNAEPWHLYGPALAQPTAIRSVGVYSTSGAALIDSAATHSLSTSYDGFTVYVASDTVTGNIHVFGYEE